MNKIKTLLLSFSIFSLFCINGLFAEESGVTFDLSIGANMNFPISTVSNIYNTSLDISNKLNQGNLSEAEKNQIIQELSDIINVANTNVRYEVYGDFGAKFNNFVAIGGEAVFNFNVFTPINNNGSKSSSSAFVMGLYPRFYTKLDLFILNLTFLTGPEVNLAFSDANSILKDAGWFYWDLGARLTIGWLMVEGFYAWNPYNNKFSDFHVGVGLEFSIF